jgi:hypothetical protein
MSVLYKFKITKPNISAQFYIDSNPSDQLNFANDSSTLAQYVGLNLEESTLSAPGKQSIPKYEEVITWNEVWERRNELRVSEKSLAEASWNDGDNGYTDIYPYPLVNPFTLTYTQILVFDTLENLITTYNNILSNDKVTELVSEATAANNVITEEIFVDGNLDTSVTLKFAGKF